MEAAYETERNGQSVISILCQAIAHMKFEMKGQRIRTLVIPKRESKNIQISEHRCTVEIRDGFNENLVVQYYGKKKIVIYIPAKWEEEIEIYVNRGIICCLQKIRHKKLKLAVRRGKILNAQEDEKCI